MSVDTPTEAGTVAPPTDRTTARQIHLAPGYKWV